MAAKGAHDRKVIKSLQECKDEGIHFVPLAWESIGGATETVHETIRNWTELEGSRGGYPAHLIRRNLYAQISCCLQRRLTQSVLIAVWSSPVSELCKAFWSRSRLVASSWRHREQREREGGRSV